tara:strand:+ start:1510 stop:1809 length:300 start_codon:yes stop_codon:yes gene_type:complete
MITPHRQKATIEPVSTPPPIIRRLNMECTEKRWADYDDDEALPEFVFGKRIKPVVAENLLTKFKDVGTWRREQSEEWILVNRTKPKKVARWEKKSNDTM